MPMAVEEEVAMAVVAKRVVGSEAAVVATAAAAAVVAMVVECKTLKSTPAPHRTCSLSHSSWPPLPEYTAASRAPHTSAQPPPAWAAPCHRDGR